MWSAIWKEELAFHLEREAQKHIANGVSPAEARARAVARFGSVTVAADECRDARGTALVDNWCETSSTPFARSAGRRWWP